MNLLLGIVYVLVGVALIVWAMPLSLRYNAWTTGIRERHPDFNPPPTPEWRGRNTLIMTVLFRVFGGVLLVLSLGCFLRAFSSSKTH